MHPRLTEASARDATGSGPSASAPPPGSLVDLIGLVIRCLLKSIWAVCLRPYGVPAWWHDRPDLPLGSAQALAASIRGPFGNAIAWMCLRRGIGPGHQDWPELSRAIVAFGGSVQGFRPGLPACGLQWWENPAIVPGMIGMPAATPAADAMAERLSRPAMAEAPPPPLVFVSPEAEPAVSPAPRRPVLARAATGPPTGPPAYPHQPLFHARRTGPAHGQSRRPDSRAATPRCRARCTPLSCSKSCPGCLTGKELRHRQDSPRAIPTGTPHRLSQRPLDRLRAVATPRPHAETRTRMPRALALRAGPRLARSPMLPKPPPHGINAA